MKKPTEAEQAAIIEYGKRLSARLEELCISQEKLAEVIGKKPEDGKPVSERRRFHKHQGTVDDPKILLQGISTSGESFAVSGVKRVDSGSV